MSKRKKPLTEVLAAAVEGLLLPSEADHPFEVVEWEHAATALATAASFKKLVGAPAKARAESLDAEKFLAPHCADREGLDDEGKAMAAKYRALREVLHAELHDLRVFRIGALRITTYLVGRLGSGDVVGLKALQIET